MSKQLIISYMKTYNTDLFCKINNCFSPGGKSELENRQKKGQSGSKIPKKGLFLK